MEEKNDWDSIDMRWEELPETMTELSPEDNGYEPTIEIYSEDTNEMVLDNNPRLPKNNKPVTQ